MWINDCEEEELLYDWSDRNTNIAQKQEAFSVSPAPGAGPLPPGGAGAVGWAPGEGRACVISPAPSNSAWVEGS